MTTTTADKVVMMIDFWSAFTESLSNMESSCSGNCPVRNYKVEREIPRSKQKDRRGRQVAAGIVTLEEFIC